MALPQHNRLRTSRDFSRVYRKGKRATTSNLALRATKLNPRRVVSSSVDGESPSALLPSGGLSTESNDQLSTNKSSNNLSLEGPNEGPKFGISISRKVSKRAVVRNRIKRQIRAIIRQQFLAIDPRWQVVIVVKPSAIECSFDDFLRELKYLLQKLAVQ